MSKISLTLGQFLTLSETQAKILVSQGYEIVIGSETSKPTVAKATEQSKVVAKTTTPKPTKKVVNNNTSSTTKSSAKTSKPTLTFGKVKVGDYFKVYKIDFKTKQPIEIVAVGKATKVANKIVSTKGGKKYAIENCVVITKITYTKLKKELGGSKKSTESGTPKAKKVRVPLLAYTIAACLKAKTINPEIDYINYFADGKEVSDKECHDILKNIKKELPDWKFSAEEAAKICVANQNEYKVFNDMKFAD